MGSEALPEPVAPRRGGRRSAAMSGVAGGDVAVVTWVSVVPGGRWSAFGGDEWGGRWGGGLGGLTGGGARGEVAGGGVALVGRRAGAGVGRGA